MWQGGIHGIGCAWQGGMHGGGVYGRGHVWQGGHAWQGVMHDRGHAWEGCVHARGSIHLYPKILTKIYIRLLGEKEFFCMYTLGSEENEFLIVLGMLSDAFELDANVVNFVYYGKLDS